MPSHLRVYQRNVPPIDRMMTRCKVCSQWVDADRTQSPEACQTSYVVSGSTYFAKGTGGELDLQAIDKEVFPQVAPYLGCSFCGSPRWHDGAAGSLRK